MLRLMENRRSSVSVLIVVGALLISLVVAVPRFRGCRRSGADRTPRRDAAVQRGA